MTPIMEAEARLTTQNQITIPAPIRKALRLSGGKSRVKFEVLPGDGRVLVSRVDSPARHEEDPALKPFLKLLAKDISENPKRIKAFPAELLGRIRSVVEGVEADLDGPLTGED
jgi:antitoxin PrlF